MDTEKTKPRILVVSFKHRNPNRDDIPASLLTKLEHDFEAELQTVKEPEPALQLLSEQPPPSAVIMTDDGLTFDENAHVWDAVLQYIRQGGTAVAMGRFSRWGRRQKVKPFFAKAGLQWELTRFSPRGAVINKMAVGDGLELNQRVTLPLEYTQRVMFLKNVSRVHAWYAADKKSVVESWVSEPTAIHLKVKAAAALARVGDGKLGFFGNANPVGDEKSDAIILALCGLLARTD